MKLTEFKHQPPSMQVLFFKALGRCFVTVVIWAGVFIRMEKVSYFNCSWLRLLSLSM